MAESSKLVRWKVVLPIVMTYTSAILMVLERAQQYQLRGRGTGWDVPARVINFALNGPFLALFAVWIPSPHWLYLFISFMENDFFRLIAVALGWTLVGWAVDRRALGQRLDFEHPNLALTLFTIGAFSCAGFGTLLFREMDRTDWSLVREYPLRFADSASVATQAWCVLLTAYFLRRLWMNAAALKQKTRRTNVRLNGS